MSANTLREVEIFQEDFKAKLALYRRLDSIDADFSMDSLAKRIRAFLPPEKSIAFVSGNFNVVHPGHFRLLNFASDCADYLLVGIHNDASPGTLISQDLRLESIRAISCVDLAFILPHSVEEFLFALKPNVVVKGSEHEQYFNPEKEVIESYGGKLLFSSGEMRFSSLDLLRKELHEVMFSTIRKPQDYLERHTINPERFHTILKKFSALSIAVIGDLIVDEYVTCDPLGLSKEDPTIVVTPIKRDIFIGGAGIVAAHAKSLGANVHYFSVVGEDETAKYAARELKKYGVKINLIQDSSRQTTLKQRFRAESKTLLRVSHLRHHYISSEISDKILLRLKKIIKQTDLLIFSDFNYGCLPQHLVNEIIELCHRYSIPMVADSQSSSQIGDVSRFYGMLLITPTEHEARLAVRDQTSGLIVLAESLRQKANAEHVMITLGVEGLLIHSPNHRKNNLFNDQLPAFNVVPKDVSGGGDCLLVCTSLALATGANIWESAYLGSIGAACHVGRIGNLPLTIQEILSEVNA